MGWEVVWGGGCVKWWGMDKGGCGGVAMRRSECMGQYDRLCQPIDCCRGILEAGLRWGCKSGTCTSELLHGYHWALACNVHMFGFSAHKEHMGSLFAWISVCSQQVRP